MYHGGKANCVWSFAKQAEAEQTLSVSSWYFKENVFAASLDALVDKGPTFHSARKRHLFGSPCFVRCLIQMWMQLKG